MSGKDRHPEIDNGTIGNLFRRMTLATLGLDGMDGVSDESFKAIERADAFVDRLIGGISHVMPKVEADRVEHRATGLADHIFAGMSGLNGPRNATDLGDWQYWLDAALLMLFDEEEDAEESAVHSAAAPSRRAASQAAIRDRVVALKNSGVKPSMIQALSADQKRSLIASLKTETKRHEGTDSHAVAQALKQSLEKAQSSAQQAMGRVFPSMPGQVFASHIVERASAVSARLSEIDGGNRSDSGKVSALARKWSESVSSISESGRLNVASVREMIKSLDGLEEIGAVSHIQATQLREAGRAYARQVFEAEMSNDVMALAGHAEAMASRLATRPMRESGAVRAVSVVETPVMSSETLKRSFATLNDRLDRFNSAVSARVLSGGETAATMRWQRAADRFVRMQGVSDDVDRVLLRDVVESAAALGEAGIVSREAVRTLVSSASEAKGSQSGAASVERSVISRMGKDVASDAVMLANIGATRILSKTASKVESLVESMVGGLVGTGVSVDAVNALVEDVRKIVASGQGAENESDHAMSVIKTSSVIESLSARLDEFAQMAASTVATHGYDDLTSDSATYVSTAEVQQGEAAMEEMRAHVAAQAGMAAQTKEALSSVRTLQAALKSANERAQAHVREIAASSSEAASQRQLLDALVSAKSAQDMIHAQKAVEPHLSVEQREELKKTIETVQRTERHLQTVSRQIRVIENTSKLSEELRNAIAAGKQGNALSTVSGANTVRLGDMRINTEYLPALGETIGTYAKMRGEIEELHSTSRLAGMSGERLERMLSVVKPSESVKTVSAQTVSDQIARLVEQGTAVSFGYDEIIPSSVNWVSSVASVSNMAQILDMSREQSVNQPTGNLESRLASYPSGERFSGLSSVLGTKKAIEILSASVASGRTEQVESLGEAISKWARTSGHDRRQSYASYSMGDDGTQVKVSLDVSKNNDTYSLRNEVGRSYQPASVRNVQSTPVTAKFNVEKAGNLAVSGADDFVPVMAGANRTETVASNSARSESMPRTAEYAGILGGMNIRLAGGMPSIGNSDSRMVLNVGGVNFEMSSSDFVQMVARPAMLSTVAANPIAVDAGNAMFAGYASLMNEQGERRSLKSLRRAYIDSVSQSGARSAHSEIGFSTQSFTNILGVSTPAFSASLGRSSVGYADSEMSGNGTFVSGEGSSEISGYGMEQSSQDETGVATSEALAKFLMEARSQRTSESFGDAGFSWVSNHASSQVLDYAEGKGRPESRHEGSRQVLGRIDSLLDYVESMSTRDVGVFSSSEDTVRVLLEAVSPEGELGNKGLPKWRQRDTKAVKIAEARELREALAKIGASPIQGTQRFNDRKFVSPNLFPEATQAAPLFSGGSEGATGSNPGMSAHASDKPDQEQSKKLPESELEFLAEDIYQRMLDSLDEELQRRRTE